MDDLVDLELEAVDKIFNKIMHDKEPNNIKQVEIDTWKLLYKTGKKGRRTGLGFTALGDAIAALGIKFDSEEALKTAEEIMRTKLAGEFDSSIDMAIERGSFERRSYYFDYLRYPALLIPALLHKNGGHDVRPCMLPYVQFVALRTICRETEFCAEPTRRIVVKLQTPSLNTQHNNAHDEPILPYRRDR